PVAEFAPASWQHDAPLLVYLFLALVGVIACRKKHCFGTLALLAFGYLAVRHNRFGPECFLATCGETARGWEDLLQPRLHALRKLRPAALAWALPRLAGFTLVLGAFLWLAPHGVGYFASVMQVGADLAVQPIGAANYLQKAGARGRLYNGF